MTTLANKELEQQNELLKEQQNILRDIEAFLNANVRANERLADKVNQTNDLFSQVVGNEKKLNKEIDKSLKGFEAQISSTSDLTKHIETAFLNSEKLQKKFKNTKDIVSAMQTDQELFNQIQKGALAAQESQIKKYWEPVDKHLSNQIDVIKDLDKRFDKGVEIKREAKDLALEATEELKKQIKLQKLQGEHGEGFFADMKRFVIEFEKAPGLFSKIGVTVSNLSRMGFTKVLLGGTAALGIGAVITGLGKMKDGFDSLLGIELSINPIVTGFQLLFKGVQSLWEHVDKQVLPTFSKLNQTFGIGIKETKAIGNQAVQAGLHFDRLGLGFETGAAAVVDFAAAMKTTDVNQELTQLGLKLTQFVGIAPEQAGKLAIAFDRSGEGAKGLTAAMVEAQIAAEEFGVVPNQIRRDMAENIDVVQRFGTANRVEFLQSAAVSRQYGLSIKEVNAAFGDQFDSFDQTADAAAKLNSILGTNINSFELMLETDPTKRMQMLGKELLEQGKHWGNLNVFEKNVLTQTLKIDKATAGLVFSEKNLGKSTEETSKIMAKRLKKQEDVTKANKQWEMSVGSLRSTLLNFKAEVDQIFQEIGRITIDLASQLFDLKLDPKNLAGSFREIFGTIRNFLKGINVQEDIVNPIVTMTQKVKDFFDSVSNSTGFRLLSKFFTSDKPKETTEEIEKRIEALSGGAENLKQLFRGSGMLGVGATPARDIDARRIAEEKKRQQERENSLVLEGPGTNVQDALITNSGKLIKFSPQDNILAVKNLESLMPKPVASSQPDFNPVASEIKELTSVLKNLTLAQSQTQTQQRQPEVKVEIVDINMDGRKVGEAQVRISRN